MIGAVAELFVERSQRAPARAAGLAAATRVLAVDACTQPRRTADLLRALERSAPVAAGLAALDRLDLVPADCAVDRILVFTDSGSDGPYCRLAAAELGERLGGAPVSLVGVGDAAALGAALVLPASALGAAPPWRRSRAFSDGAAVLWAFLREGEGAAA